MTWQARRRSGLRERSCSSLLPAALAHHHAQPCASRSTSQPAQSQLSHRTGRRRFASGMPAAWSPQRQELRSSCRSRRFMFLASWLPGESAGLHIAIRREYHHSSQPTSKTVLCSSILLCLCTAGLCVACLHKQRHPSARRASRSGQMGVF